MDYGSSPKKIEQEEIIEHYVTEERRISGGTNDIGGPRGPMKEIMTETIERRYNEELPFHDFYRTSSPPGSSALDTEAERRFYATGERDRSRDASFMQTSGMSSARELASATGTAAAPGGFPRTSGTLDRSGTNIDSYGYDVHEVHTSEGGARIVQTHGTGLIRGDGSTIQQTERSLNQQRMLGDRGVEHHRTTLIQERSESNGSRRPGISSALKAGAKEVGFLGSVRSAASGIGTSPDLHRQAVYTLPSPSAAKMETWRRVGTGLPDSMSEMIEQLPQQVPPIFSSSLSRKDSYKRMQMGQQDDLADVYAPRSDASLMAGFNRSRSQSTDQTLTPWEQAVQFIRKLVSRARNTTWTPRLVCLLLLFLLLITLFFVLLGIILNALFGSYSTRTLLLYPPLCDDCRRRAPNGVYERTPSTLYVHFYSSSQVHLELIGNPPFRSNSFTAIDFETGFVAIADHALIDGSGRHTTCFLMPLDRSAVPSMSALRDALSTISSEIYSEYGWQEYWQYQAEPIDAVSAERKFSYKIDDCRGAKWYFLKHTVYTRDSSCSECYDFCLPDYGIQRLHKYEDDMTIGIRRLDCFRLYVPEWAKYTITSDSQGGHWSYPRISSNTQRDAHGNWVSWNQVAK